MKHKTIILRLNEFLCLNSNGRHQTTPINWVLKRPTEFMACARAVRLRLRIIVVIREDSKSLTVWRFHCKSSTFPSVILRPECWTDQGLNPWPLAQQTGAYPTAVWSRISAFHCNIMFSFSILIFTLFSLQPVWFKPFTP